MHLATSNTLYLVQTLVHILFMAMLTSNVELGSVPRFYL